MHEAQAAVCDVIEQWEHGTVVRATRHPTYWDYNLVRVEDDADIDADELVAFADEALAGLAHRRVGFEVVSAGERTRAGMEALGWKVTRLVWMRHEGETPPATGVDVEQVAYDVVHHLRLTWLREDFPDVDFSDYFEHAREVDMRRNAQVFAAFEQDRPVGFAQLEREGGAAEITGVFVHPEKRGHGLGRAITQAAIAAAGEVSDLWIVADDDDRPKELYARLGFRPVWKLVDFLRVPST